MTPVLEVVIASLIIVLIIVLVVITVFLVKFIQEATITSIKELTDVTRKEMEPALKSVNNILATVSNVSTATNKQLELIKKILTTLLGASCVAFGTVKNKGGFISGLISGFKTFRNKRR